MKNLNQVPGARLAIGAFTLTVLLGAGTAGASALWQQSATATMTVTADGAWGGPAFTLTCSDPTKKSVSLDVAVSQNLSASQSPAQLSVAVVGSSTTYSEGQIVAPNKSGTISLGTNHALILSQPSGLINIQVTVTYKDNTSSSVQRQIRKGNGNSEVTCI